MTTKFPKSEIYGLSSQLQRASVSLPANIAERHQRQHSKEFLGSSLLCVGKQLLQVSLTQRIDSPRFLDRINRMDRMLPVRLRRDRQ